MFRDKMVSVAMPAYNEEENILQAVTDFLANSYVDEVVVADNNSVDSTAKLAKKAGARVIRERKQGYGFACQRAMREAKGDYIILVEPDGTFDAKDVIKLLAYADDFDAVLGTRISRDLIWEGANMGAFLKWGNFALAKMIEVLYNGPLLSDVGCTYRLIKREALKKIDGKFTVGGSYFSPEMMVLIIKNKVSVIEIPVNYKPRKGKSKITGKKKDAFVVGLKMLKLIFLNLFKR